MHSYGATIFLQAYRVFAAHAFRKISFWNFVFAAPFFTEVFFFVALETRPLPQAVLTWRDLMPNPQLTRVLCNDPALP